MAYAEETKVPVDKTRAELERLIRRYRATAFGTFTDHDTAIVVFAVGDRRIRFDLPLPVVAGRGGKTSVERTDQEHRRRWRALLLCLKAKLEAVDSKIETFEEAFLAHIQLPDGTTVGANIGPHIDRAYKDGLVGPLLPMLPRPS